MSGWVVGADLPARWGCGAGAEPQAREWAPRALMAAGLVGDRWLLVFLVRLVKGAYLGTRSSPRLLGTGATWCLGTPRFGEVKATP